MAFRIVKGHVSFSETCHIMSRKGMSCDGVSGISAPCLYRSASNAVKKLIIV